MPLKIMDIKYPWEYKATQKENLKKNKNEKGIFY